MNFINPEQFSIISEIAGISTEKRETVSVAESNSGGIVPPACFLILMRLPIFLAGAVLFSYPIRASLLRIGRAEHETFGGCPTEIIKRLVGALQRKTATTWGIGEGGAAGPTPSHDGHPPGFTVFAIMEPLECVATMETVSNDRIANMAAFPTGLLKLFLITLRKHHRTFPNAHSDL